MSENIVVFDPPAVVDESPISDSGARDYGTDLDASLRFVEANADRLRYVPGIGWHVWDGMRWAKDTTGRALEYSKASAKAWTTRWVASQDANRNDKVRMALSLESASHIKAALELAQTDERLVIHHSKLDIDPWLLTVRNGTIDLRSGNIRPHSRDDYITKLAPVTYTPDARNAILDGVLGTLDEGMPGASDFLARCFGAALSGDASPESVFLLQGDGASGKTTLTEGISSLLGDYSVKLPFESFCLSKHGRSPGGASPDLIRLRGSRFAYASEGDVSARLDAGTVKTLTGGEPFTCRDLYQSPITFPQTWKLWLVSNYDPKADSDDTGIWRRMLKIHFQVVPPERRDPRVKTALCSDPAAQSALLAWAVRGCLDWQARGRGRNGLAPPPAVLAITEAYRKKQDALGQWLEDALAEGGIRDGNASTPNSELRSDYERWCEDNGSLPCNGNRFATFLELQGFERFRGHGGVRRWKGISLGGR